MADFSFDLGSLLGGAISSAGQLYANQKNIQNQNRLFSVSIHAPTRGATCQRT